MPEGAENLKVNVTDLPTTEYQLKFVTKMFELIVLLYF